METKVGFFVLINQIVLFEKIMRKKVEPQYNKGGTMHDCRQTTPC